MNMLTTVSAVAVLAAAVAAGASSLRAADTPAAAVNSRLALSRPISELNVDAVSLGKTLSFLRDSTGANIVVNWKVLEGVGVAQETPITLSVRNLTLRKMLQLVLDQASPNVQLVYSIDANVIQITTQEDADRQMVTKVYVVDDLVMAPNVRRAPTLNLQQTSTTAGQGGGIGSNGQSNGSGGIFGNNTSSGSTDTQTTRTVQERGDDLVTLIREVVRPSIWRENGGTASIKFFSGKLIVTAPISVHEAIGGPVSESAVRYGS